MSETALENHDKVLEQAADWQRAGDGVALATVVETWGSAPRPVGSQLAVRADGAFIGSVSGGCIEGAVVVEAQDIIESGTPKLLEFGVSNSRAWEVGLACGGKIRVFVERLG
ncbi:MAG TPA: XdhC/CoxI family protein [Alphaproteobacteria bacterium]|jgi:xanthine/CO dehydrogenase XdhC/CoxF family maturation factor|nr:XdhC/CoxI family protein [Alphaproteobacteria bacterium]HBC53523.1 XdhC/CoxI family protein [Alphaproteobacteria bacterium]HBF99299.1 XdhC/CoxI family protein [Alphaproteobacteria bacterium]HCO89701.1 XdhC/CoxI family protein [Alphaproteobacteria bacterium]